MLTPWPMRKKLTPSQLYPWGFPLTVSFTQAFGSAIRSDPYKGFRNSTGKELGNLFPPLKQAKICGHGRPASRAVLKHQGSWAAMTFQGLFTSQSTLLMSNQPKAHYKLKEKQKKPNPPPTAHTHITVFQPGRGRIIFLTLMHRISPLQH